MFARSRPNHGSELSTNELLWFAMPNPWSWAVPRSFVLQTGNEPVRKTKTQQLETGLNGNKPKVSQYYCISFGMKGRGNLRGLPEPVEMWCARILDEHEQKRWTMPKMWMMIEGEKEVGGEREKRRLRKSDCVADFVAGVK